MQKYIPQEVKIVCTKKLKKPKTEFIERPLIHISHMVELGVFLILL